MSYLSSSQRACRRIKCHSCVNVTSMIIIVEMHSPSFVVKSLNVGLKKKLLKAYRTVMNYVVSGFLIYCNFLIVEPLSYILICSQKEKYLFAKV